MKYSVEISNCQAKDSVDSYTKIFIVRQRHRSEDPESKGLRQDLQRGPFLSRTSVGNKNFNRILVG